MNYLRVSPLLQNRLHVAAWRPVRAGCETIRAAFRDGGIIIPGLIPLRKRDAYIRPRYDHNSLTSEYPLHIKNTREALAFLSAAVSILRMEDNERNALWSQVSFCAFRKTAPEAVNLLRNFLQMEGPHMRAFGELRLLLCRAPGSEPLGAQIDAASSILYLLGFDNTQNTFNALKEHFMNELRAQSFSAAMDGLLRSGHWELVLRDWASTAYYRGTNNPGHINYFLLAAAGDPEIRTAALRVFNNINPLHSLEAMKARSGAERIDKDTKRMSAEQITEFLITAMLSWFSEETFFSAQELAVMIGRSEQTVAAAIVRMLAAKHLLSSENGKVALPE